MTIFTLVYCGLKNRLSLLSVTLTKISIITMSINKGALNLLACYGGDSSDDEVPGCRVSTKRVRKDSESDCDHTNYRRVSR